MNQFELDALLRKNPLVTVTDKIAPVIISEAIVGTNCRINVIEEKPQPKRSKYRNTPTVVDGIRFDSKKEAEWYVIYKEWVEEGILKLLLRQVPFYLPGGVKMVVDFMHVRADGEIHLIDIKPWDKKAGRFRLTQSYINKKKQVRAIYKVDIEEV